MIKVASTFLCRLKLNAANVSVASVSIANVPFKRKNAGQNPRAPSLQQPGGAMLWDQGVRG
jgi:hypothetical protein